MKEDIISLSGTEIIQELGKKFAKYRKRMKFTQKEISEQSGLSVFTISGFENGTQTGLTLGSFIKLMRAIGELEQMADLLPDLPQSPSEVFFEMEKKKKK